MKKVLVGGPLRQDMCILREHLKSIDGLDKDGIQLDKFYIVNDCPEAKELLKDGEYIEVNTNDTYTKTEQTHTWTQFNLFKMCELRNRFIRQALDGGYDYAFFVDTDLVLQPETLRALIDSEKDIVAEVFWTRSDPNENWAWANAWDYDQSHTEPESYEKWVLPGTYEVGGTGACMLVSRRALLNGCNYHPIYNIKKALIGEDRWFMIRAAVNGFRLYLNTEYPATHLYRMSEYEAYMEETYGTNR